MKITKNNKLNKTTVAELHETFFKDGTTYENYFIGSIKCTNGEYTFTPTDADDVYSEEDKLKILQNVLEDEVYLYGNEDDKSITKTKKDNDYLEAYSTMRSNMYGGLTIVDQSENEKTVANVDSEQKSQEPDPELVITKNKKLSP